MRTPKFTSFMRPLRNNILPWVRREFYGRLGPRVQPLRRQHRTTYYCWCGQVGDTVSVSKTKTDVAAASSSQVREGKRLLIVGSLGSGTLQMSRALTALGVEVGHETSDSWNERCRDGTASWAHGIRFLR